MIKYEAGMMFCAQTTHGMNMSAGTIRKASRIFVELEEKEVFF
jgi:hypothetical protein